MSETRRLRASERWARLLLRLYPADFRAEMGESLVETYQDRCREAVGHGGLALARVWVRGFADSLRNGLGERSRHGRAWRGGGNWRRDMALVTRRLKRAPIFGVTIVATLTVGLGAFAVVYTAVDKVLIEPLPYEHPEDLYYVWRDYGPIFDLDRGWLSGPDIVELDAAGGAIEGAVGMRREMRTLSGGGDAEPEEVAVMFSSPGLFGLLGVRPVLGRGFAPEEVGSGRERVVVLGHDLWTERFGADTAIVGSEVWLNDYAFRVIGVMGRSFRFVPHSSLGPPQAVDLYTTFAYDLAERSPTSGSFAGLMRARPGTSPEVVEAAVTGVGAAIDERDFDSRGLSLYPIGVRADLVSRVRPALVVLGASGAFLVLVLAVNVATLLLARAAQREREFAVSRALGANGLALARATILEGSVLGLLGGIGGVTVAVWGTRALVALAPLDLPRRASIAVDWQIASVVVVVGASVGLLAGLVPAAWAYRTRLSALLSNAAVRGGGGHARMRRGMVVVQVALSLVLLSAGGLVVRSFGQLLRAEPGFESEGVLTMRVPVPQLRYPDDATAQSLHEAIERELSGLPGVAAVGATTGLPLSASASGQTTAAFPGAPGNTGDPEQDQPLVDFFRTRPGYFDALGISVLAGQTFDDVAPDGVREAVIDRTLATAFFPTGNPVGATLRFGGDSLTVIGVVDHARLYDIHRDDRPHVYLRNGDTQQVRTLSWALRTDRRPRSLVSEVRAAVHRIDPQLAISEIRSMDQVVSESLQQQRLSAVLITGFSVGALLLAAMGLFGVVSGSVTRRRHELSVRLALGANHGRVLRLVIREGALLVALGLLLGVPGIYLSGQAIRGVLVDVSPFDPLTLAAVACGLALVALAACYVPARRVAGIDPAQSLREE